jgi:hypothetical protein
LEEIELQIEAGQAGAVARNAGWARSFAGGRRRRGRGAFGGRTCRVQRRGVAMDRKKGRELVVGRRFDWIYVDLLDSLPNCCPIVCQIVVKIYMNMI